MSLAFSILPGYTSNDGIPSMPPLSVTEQSAATPAVTAAVSPINGAVEIFEFNKLALEASNVKEIKQGSVFDGMEGFQRSLNIYSRPLLFL